jgi:hypothetical protein
MRSRTEIELDTNKNKINSRPNDEIIIELLLDIRDFLYEKQNSSKKP